MKKIICFFTIFVFWGITDSMAQGLHFCVHIAAIFHSVSLPFKVRQYVF